MKFSLRDIAIGVAAGWALNEILRRDGSRFGLEQAVKALDGKSSAPSPQMTGTDVINAEFVELQPRARGTSAPSIGMPYGDGGSRGKGRVPPAVRDYVQRLIAQGVKMGVKTVGDRLFYVDDQGSVVASVDEAGNGAIDEAAIEERILGRVTERLS